jgi:hypothetical protein
MGFGRTLSLSEPGGTALGPWGRIEIADRQHLRVRNMVGSREFDVNGWLDGAANLVGWFDRDTGTILLAGRGEHIVRLDLVADVIESVANLDREEDEHLRHLSFREVDGAVICLFELGVVCLDLSGAVRWKVRHDDLSAEFAGTRNGLIWLASQWPPDRAGHRFAFRLADGARVSG